MIYRHSNLWVLFALCCAACTSVATQAPASPTPRMMASPTLPTPTSVTPSPTASPAPAPRLFTETFDGTIPYWSFLQAGNDQAMTTPSSRDGFLVFDLPSANQWAYAIYDGAYYGDVTVELRAQYRTRGDGSVGVVCRYDKARGWYELNVFADQTYELLYGQWLSPGVAGYTPLYRGHSDAISVDENSIALECRGSALTPFINGVQMTKRLESNFKLLVGKIGLDVSSFESAPFTVALDSVKVRAP